MRDHYDARIDTITEQLIQLAAEEADGVPTDMILALIGAALWVARQTTKDDAVLTDMFSAMLSANPRETRQ